MKIENATFERNGNKFFVTPGSDSIVSILVLANRNNPPALVRVGVLEYIVIDKFKGDPNDYVVTGNIQDGKKNKK